MKILIIALLSLPVYAMDLSKVEKNELKSSTMGEKKLKRLSKDSVSFDLEKGQITFSHEDELPDAPSNTPENSQKKEDGTEGFSSMRTAIITGVSSLLLGGISAAITYFSSHSNNNNCTSSGQ